MLQPTPLATTSSVADNKAVSLMNMNTHTYSLVVVVAYASKSKLIN